MLTAFKFASPSRSPFATPDSDSLLFLRVPFRALVGTTNSACLDDSVSLPPTPAGVSGSVARQTGPPAAGTAAGQVPDCSSPPVKPTQLSSAVSSTCPALSHSCYSSGPPVCFLWPLLSSPVHYHPDTCP